MKNPRSSSLLRIDCVKGCVSEWAAGFVIVCFATSCLTGCDLVDGARVLLFGRSSSDKDASNGKRLSPAEMAAQESKQNASLLQEMIRVVYMTQPKNSEEFSSYVYAMNQGASLEGIYNGLTHSSNYRKLETDHPGAKIMALQFFADELARTELEMPAVTQFASTAAQPLSAPIQPTGTDSEIDFPGASPTAAATPAVANSPASTPSTGISLHDDLMRKYARDFAGASYFTLKRVLSDEVLNLLNVKSSDPKALALWYGNWVHHMDGLHVDFGIPLRNNPDAEFHRQWAQSVSGDRLRWEVLNRIHRVINQAELPNTNSGSK